MYTTQLDNGVLNSYAVEPQMTYQEYPTVYEKRRYVIQGALASLIVTATVIMSIAIS